MMVGPASGISSQNCSRDFKRLIAREGHCVRPDFHDALTLVDAHASMGLRFAGQADRRQQRDGEKSYIHCYTPHSFFSFLRVGHIIDPASAAIHPRHFLDIGCAVECAFARK